MANQDLQQLPNSPWPTAGKMEVAASLKERTEKAAEHAAGSAIEQVRSAKTSISHQRDQVAERIRRVGDLMRESGDRVRADDETAAAYLRMASQRIDGVASYVSSTDFSTMAADTQEFIRKRPAVFFGGTFLLGLAAGRFFRASAGGSAVRRPPNTETAASQGGSSSSATGSSYAASLKASAFDTNTGIRDSLPVGSGTRPGTPSNMSPSSNGHASSRQP